MNEGKEVRRTPSIAVRSPEARRQTRQDPHQEREE